MSDSQFRAQGAVASTLIGIAVLLATPVTPARTQEATSVSLSIKDHRFDPAEIEVPANKPIVLRIKNLDKTPIEFESESLHVEKVIGGNAEGVVRLRPLKPGRYEFFDEFHPAAKGVLTAR
jgi:hypothetical protein